MATSRRATAIVLFLLLAALPAAARQLTIQSFDAQVEIHPDGTMEVIETIEAHFTGSWNGIYRTIPIEYRSPQGLDFTLFLEPLSVTDDNANPLKYEQSRQGHSTKFKIWVPGAQDATRTVLLHYRVLNGLGFFEDHDELYWNVTGDEWEVPIEQASARIILPAGVTGLRAVAYTGVYGSREQNARVVVKGNEAEIHATRPLRYREGLTAVIGWDKGFVKEPGAAQKLSLFFRSNWPFFLPLFAFLIMFWLWWTRGRDPERDVVTVQYEPPDKLTPGECGTLVDNEASMRDITATLVDLAVKGYLVIEQKEDSKLLGLMHGKEYIFHLKKPPAEWSGARAHEQEMLSALFEGGARDSVKLSELQNHFYTHLSTIRNRIFDALMTDGYYLHRPDRVRQAYIAGGLVVGAIVWWGGTVASKPLGMSPLTWTIAGIATAIVICGFGWFMPARTITGARTFAKVLGFEDFLGRVESDRIQRMENAPELFEKFLPYAMALHVEKKWVQAFAGIAMQPPQWYQGPYGAGFQPILFVSDLNVMSMQAGSAMASAPRSAGGSGFGGGGFSGGGMGGGGGGGF